jgi:hypothetical protein
MKLLIEILIGFILLGLALVFTVVMWTLAVVIGVIR